MDSPLMVALVAVEWSPVQAEHAGEGVTVYPVIVDPPSEAGALNDRPTVDMLTVACTLVGDPGDVGGLDVGFGTTGFDGADGRPVPVPLVAATVNV